MKDLNVLRKLAFASDTDENVEKFWLEKLAGDIVKVSFPYDQQKGDGGCVEFKLTDHIFAVLDKLSNNSLPRLQMILTAGITALLYKYTGMKDIIIGTSIYKQDSESEFINTVLALRNRLDDSLTFKQMILNMRDTLTEANANQNYPIELLLQKLKISYGKDDDFPLFDVVVLLENIQDKKYIGYIKTNMLFCFFKTGDSIGIDSINGVVEYNSDLYQRETIERIVTHFKQLLEKVLPGLDRPIGTIDVLTEAEKMRLLLEYNNTEACYPVDRTIYELFREQVERLPDHLAIHESGMGRALTYRELRQVSGHLAAFLRAQGATAEQVVALIGACSMNTVVGILAILETGAAYLPVDPKNPDERIRYILADSAVRLVVVQKNIIEERHAIFKKLNREHMIALADDMDYRDYPGHADFSITYRASDMAYVIYTSGTTGQPKGVIIEHRSLVNYIYWATEKYIKNAARDFPFYTSVAFDLTITSIFMPLVTGNAIWVYGGDNDGNDGDVGNIIERIFADNKVGVMKLTPSHLQMIRDKKITAGDLQVKCFIVGGEALESCLARDIHDQGGGNIEIYNEYGPTEATIGCMMYRFNPSQDIEYSVPIGIPANNMQIYLLDSGLNPVPPGAAGEIWIGGIQVGRGYLNRPELTAEKFKKHRSYGSYRTYISFYKTGDLARWLTSGNVEFLGRADSQVKIRGYRIEPREIEARLLMHHEVKWACVIVHKNKTGDKDLCAYVVSEQTLMVPEIKDYLRQTLPEYMVPAYFVSIDRVPLTANGKIDYHALPDPVAAIKTPYAPPRDEVEIKLAALWSDVLALETHTIGIDYNFFELGGHSLKAAILAAKIHEEFNIKLPLSEIFRTPTIRGVAKIIRQTVKGKFIPVEPVEKREYYELSSAQERLFVLQQMETAGTFYNVPHVMNLEGALNKERLESAFKGLIDRHESFRTSFISIVGKPVQRIHGAVDFEIEYYDLTGKTAGPQVIIKSFFRPFDLAQAPLIRAGLIKIEIEKHILMVDIHHIAADGFSMGIIIKEFMMLLDGEELPPAKIHYKDYAYWQKNEVIQDQQEYWKKELAGEIPLLRLPLDFPRPPVQSFEGDRTGFEFSHAETAGIVTFAQEKGVTLYVFMLAVFYVCLAKLSGQDDIIIGTPVLGRQHVDLENIIGMFVNTLALRNYPQGDKNFLEFLQEVKICTLAAFDNQGYPFESLLDDLELIRDISRNPLFDVSFALHKFDTPKVDISGLALKPFPFTNTLRKRVKKQEFEALSSKKGRPLDLARRVGAPPHFENLTSKFDLNLEGIEMPDRLIFSFEYGTKLFKKATIKRFSEYFKRVATLIVTDPVKKIREIEIISAEEKERILYHFNQTGAEYPSDKTVDQLFAEQVTYRPDHIALIGGTAVTYRQLDAQADGLAGELIQKGITADNIVAVMMEQSVDLIIAIMGVLKTGAAYLPIDPGYPQERIEYMLKDSAAAILLTANCQLSMVNSQLSMGRLGRQAACYYSNSLAYVIYTSGTTGRPKGVMVEHRSLVNLCYWHNCFFTVNGFDRAAKYAGIGFDASVWEIFPYLLAGASLCIIPGEIKLDTIELNQYFERQGITIAFLPTQVCEQFMELENRSLRKLLTGGDKLRYFKKKNYDIYNNYGPTEYTVVSTSYLVDEYYANIPIGKPAANTGIYLLAPGRNLQPVGVPGELYVGGDGLARGYLNNPELTNKSFSGGPGGRLFKKAPLVYQTGDLGRWLDDGNIEFLGRMDSQVKVRGNRIELTEIETLLIKHNAVKDAAVKAIAGDDGNMSLCAYVVSEAGIDAVTLRELREYLGKHVPGYMVPAYYVMMAHIPLTANGKVNWKALPAPVIKSDPNHTAPRDMVEEKLTEIWAEVLGIEKNIIGIDSDFFQLGGHSLKATILVSKIHMMLDVKVPLSYIFRAPCIRDLAGYIKTLAKNKYNLIEPVEKKEYYDISHAQKRLWILEQMKENQTAYIIPLAFYLQGNLDIPAFEKAFFKLIDRHETLRTVFITTAKEPKQRILQHVNGFKLDYIDLQNRTNPVETAHEWVRRELRRGFDLEKGPLVRVNLLHIDEDKYVFQLLLHHIIADGWSMNVLFAELMNTYVNTGSSPESPESPEPLRIQYKDYTAWQNKEITGAGVNPHRQYWLQQFAGHIPVIDLPLDKPRPTVKSFQGNKIDFVIESNLKEILDDLGQRTGTSLFMILLALVNVLLHLYTGQEEFIIGSPVAGRQHNELENQVGFYVNTLPIRININGIETFDNLLQKVKQIALDAYEYQAYPFDLLVEELGILNDPGRNPLFDVMVVLQNNDYTPSQIPILQDLKISGFETGHETSTFELNFHFTQLNEQIILNLIYDTDLFEELTIQVMGTKLLNLISNVGTLSDIQIKDITHDELLPTDQEKIATWDLEF